jgi:hypothetical protein
MLAKKPRQSMISQYLHDIHGHPCVKKLTGCLRESGIAGILPFSRPHPRNHPDHLLRCHRVQNPGEHQPGHSDKHNPENFPDMLVFPMIPITDLIPSGLNSAPDCPFHTPKRSPYRAPFKNNLKSALFWETDEIKRTR